MVAAKYEDISALNMLPKLEQLNLTKSTFANDLSAFSHLRRLILDQTVITSLEFVLGTPTLEHLSLQDISKLEDLSPLGRLPPGHRLHSLDLSGKRNLNLSSLAGDVLASTLTHLWLDRCTLVWAFGAPEGFRHLITGFTQLSVLVFGSTLLPKVRGNWRQEWQIEVP